MAAAQAGQAEVLARAQDICAEAEEKAAEAERRADRADERAARAEAELKVLRCSCSWYTLGELQAPSHAAVLLQFLTSLDGVHHISALPIGAGLQRFFRLLACLCMRGRLAGGMPFVPSNEGIALHTSVGSWVSSALHDEGCIVDHFTTA